jgi:DNA-binding IclR family transcriptional regulator
MSPQRMVRDQRSLVPDVPSERIVQQSNSVRRAFAILELLEASDRRRNLSEISRKLDLPKSTTSVLLSTLESMGYITRDASERRYLLTSKAFGFGLELSNQLGLSRRARPTLETVAHALRVTAHIAVLDGDQALFVNKVDGVAQPCCDIYPGRRTNLPCTAVGKILIAYMSEGQQRLFLARHRSIQHTSRTIVCPERLMEEITWVRKQGYSFDNQEEELRVRCVAVPIFGEQRPVATLGITGTLAEIRPDNIEELAAYLKKMSSQIFVRLTQREQLR